MSLKKYIPFTFIIILIIVSCGKKSSPGPSTSKKTGIAVFVIGNHTTANNLSVATCWKNGKAIALADTTTISIAAAIAISDTDVYIAGNIDGSATYWKNGKATTLSGFASYASSIAVSGNDVYVAGYTNIGNYANNDMPTYWKNGVPVLLNSGGGSAYADAIAVSGNDVYVAGNDSVGKILYWKNGVLTTIGDSPSTSPSYYNDGYPGGFLRIALSGSDVYISGETPGDITAEYWKNGVGTPLVNPAVKSALTDIVINGTDVYAAGFYSTTGYIQGSPAYWKNGVINTLPPTPQPSNCIATAIAINGSDIYVAGFGISQKINPVYWKNGTLIPLSDNNSATTGIAVVQY